MRILLHSNMPMLAREAGRARTAIDRFTAKLTLCPVHGPMKLRAGIDPSPGDDSLITRVWTCPGWDGEGCPNQWPPQ